MNEKCFICSTTEVHAFKDCVSATCQCNCVNQIYALRTNTRHNDLTEAVPHYLNIGNPEIKQLPNVDQEINDFNKINKEEWLPVKKDKRFKKKR